MVQPIQAKWIRYNANTRDKYVGDCVKRALSVAYSMDYDAVSRELNKHAKSYVGLSYASYLVYSKFLRARGDEFSKYPGSVSVEDFCDDHPSGVYLLLVGDPGKHQDHMCVSIDGDLYDSWDSTKQEVYEVAKVSSGRSDVYDIPEDIFPRLYDSLHSYIEKLNSKLPDNLELVCRDDMFKLDDYTSRIYLYCMLGDMPRYCDWNSNRKLSHRIVIKLNPRLSAEENFSILEKKCKQKIYDWVYNIKKHVQDCEAAESIKTHPKFHGHVVDLMKLPDWCREYVTAFYEEDDYKVKEYGWFKYELYMDPLPGDDLRSPVYFQADTLTDLKYLLKQYKQDFTRGSF